MALRRAAPSSIPYVLWVDPTVNQCYTLIQTLFLILYVNHCMCCVWVMVGRSGLKNDQPNWLENDGRASCLHLPGYLFP